jgi:integrase
VKSVEDEEETRAKRTAPTTIQELVDRYCEENVLRPASERAYRSAARVFARDVGLTVLAAVQREHVLAWRKEVIERCSYVSWNTYRRAMKMLFNFAVRQGWLKANSFHDVKALACSKRKKIVAKPVLAEALAILDSEKAPVSPGWFWSAVFKLLFFSGMRRRQLAELRWRDLDFDRETIMLRIEGSKTRREWEIPMPPQCVETLLALRKRSLQSCRNLEDRQVFWIQLFDSRYAGQELTVEQISYAFTRLSRRLGNKVSPHRLRHTMATDLAQGMNPDLKSLQYLLGHTELALTMEYVHPEMGQLRLQQSKLSLT